MSAVPTDIAIAQAAKLRPVAEIAAELGLGDDEVELYGKYKAKVSLKALARRKVKGRLVLVTGHQPHPRGRGQVHGDGGGDAGAAAPRQERRRLHPGAVARTGVRREGRCVRRRIRPGRSDGGHQPPLHRRLSRDRERAQPALRDAGLASAPRQCPRDRHAAHHLAPHHGHERPGAAQHHREPGGHQRGARARRPVRHHSRVGDHGDHGARHGSRRPGAAARAHHRRAHTREAAGARERPEGAGRDDAAPQGRHQSEPGADARGRAGVHPLRAVRQHRARLQFGSRDQACARAVRRGAHRRRGSAPISAPKSSSTSSAAWRG